MAENITKSRFFHRFSEILVPFLSWTLITFPLWMSPFHPAIVAYFIISFDLYYFYKAVTTTYYAVLSYKTLLNVARISFQKKVQAIKSAQDILHFIIIPNYKEPLHKIEKTIDYIVKNDFPYKNIVLVLAFEDKEVEAFEKERTIRIKYSSFFKDIISSFHPLLDHEEQGKASNQTFAAKIVDQYCQNKLIDRKNALITICDADSLLPKNYLSYLTFQYLKDADRLYHFYWAPVLLYNNFWKLPFFVRIQATLSSILRIAFLSQTENLIQISTYSTNLWLLQKIGFWDVDIIPEDWHIYFQAFFTYGEKVKTIPLYTIVNGDAVYSGGNVKTFVNRYEQEKRWAWGVTDVSYTIKKFFTTPHIAIKAKLKKILYLSENHLFWPTSFFILTLSASIPPLINPLFKRTVLGFLLPQLSGLILTLTSIMLIAYVYLDIKLRKKVNIETKIQSLPFLVIQWYLLPIISFFLSSIPALESHTRLLLGKKLKYKVTEKI